MTGRTFAPIADPLKLAEEDPAKFVAEVRSRGIELVQGESWFQFLQDESQCGCVAGTALVLHLGHITDNVYPLVIMKNLNISNDALLGLSSGFEGLDYGDDENITDISIYGQYYHIGRSVALAAGFEVAEVEA
jgi:hypothetical protein